MSATPRGGRSRRVDPGLHAVARVRDVRERDSRLGLQQAARDEHDATSEVRRLSEVLARQDSRPTGHAGEFVAMRAVYLGLSEALAEARRQEQAARLVALDAAAHWRSDHARLSAVEGLLERRTEARALEAKRHEERELDDVSGRLWLRRSRAARTDVQLETPTGTPTGTPTRAAPAAGNAPSRPVGEVTR